MLSGLPHDRGERIDEEGAGLEGAADQAHGERVLGVLQAGLADHHGDLFSELGAATLI